MARTRVLLIEDNRLLREGIAEVLGARGDFDVVAMGEDCEEIERVDTSDGSPDVVLVDLNPDKRNAIRLMATLHAKLPEARLVAMDVLPEQSDVVELVKAGASGFILESAPVQEYVDAIRAVAGGEKVLPAVLTASLFTQIVAGATGGEARTLDSGISLTEREKEVVDLISEGLSNKEIAARLHIATHTVKSHVHNILEKLALRSRLQIAAFVRGHDPE